MFEFNCENKIKVLYVLRVDYKNARLKCCMSSELTINTQGYSAACVQSKLSKHQI